MPPPLAATPARRWNSLDTSQSQIIYEGPFAKLALKLKIISVSTAALSLVGIPLAIAFTAKDVSTAGQAFVGGTAVLGATGSTIALNFCFSPYIHTLERIPVRKCHAKEETAEECSSRAAQQHFLKATTRNLLAMPVQTVFDPAQEAEPYTGVRPFCNFLVKGSLPLFVHPELIHDAQLRKQLLGEEPCTLTPEQQKMRQKDDDEFL